MASLVAVVAAVACGAFSASDPETAFVDASDDATADATSSSDAAGDASGDGAVAPGAVSPACPPPAFGAGCSPATCERRQLYAPADGATEYPWGLTTDASYVYWIAQTRGMTDTDDVAAYNGHGRTRIWRADRGGAADPSRASLLVDGDLPALSLARDGAHLYWATREESAARSASFWTCRTPAGRRPLSSSRRTAPTSGCSAGARCSAARSRRSSSSPRRT